MADLAGPTHCGEQAYGIAITSDRYRGVRVDVLGATRAELTVADRTLVHAAAPSEARPKAPDKKRHAN